ncbi:MAG: hypothetical protein ACI9EW_002021 [Cellvibrionaceae bacterium]|jgi:hypothetical protein
MFSEEQLQFMQNLNRNDVQIAFFDMLYVKPYFQRYIITFQIQQRVSQSATHYLHVSYEIYLVCFACLGPYT